MILCFVFTASCIVFPLMPQVALYIRCMFTRKHRQLHGCCNTMLLIERGADKAESILRKNIMIQDFSPMKSCECILAVQRAMVALTVHDLMQCSCKDLHLLHGYIENLQEQITYIWYYFCFSSSTYVHVPNCKIVCI